jgi:PIN domain nuclease of toxin-antitoxin system
MIAAVIDTHALIWYLYNDPRLSMRARQFMETAAQNGEQIAISSITLVELVYLIEKGRIASESLTLTASELKRTDSLFFEVPLNIDITRTLSQVNSEQIPDMPDRIIAATALHLGVPLISHDGKIAASNLNTIW